MPHCALNSKAMALGLWTLVALASLAATGCADMLPGRLNRYNPFRRDDWAAETKFGVRPYDRMQHLEQVASNSASQVKQFDVSAQLAKEFPAELDPLVRRSMVHALAKMQTPDAAATLKLALKDQNPKVRQAACEAWATRPAAEAAPLLTEVIGSDGNIDVRITAARSLGSFPQDQGAIKGLGLALEDNDPALQYRAVQSLKTISGRDYGGNIHAWRAFAKGENPPASAADHTASNWSWLPSLW